MGKMRAKRPTRRQKELIRLHNLKPENWLVSKDDREELNLVNKNTNRTRVIRK